MQLQTVDNINSLLTRYVKKCGYQSVDLKYEMQAHPDFPSMLAIKDSILNFDIDVDCFQLSDDVVFSTDFNFITFLNDNDGGKYIYVENKADKPSLVAYDGALNFKIERNIFIDSWDKKVLVIEEKPIKKNIHFDNRVLAFIGISLLFVFLPLLQSPFQLLPSIFYLLGLVGFSIAILINQEVLGISSSYVKYLCSSEKYFDCKSVLFSKYATIVNNYKISDLLITHFFSVTFLFLILSPESYLNLMLLLCLPYSFAVLLTIYFQLKLRKWCPLCLLTDILLLGHLFLAFYYFSFQVFVDYFVFEIYSYLILLLGSNIIWYNLKPILYKLVAFDKVYIESLSFRRNWSLLRSHLYTSKIVIQNDIEKNWPKVYYDNGYIDLFLILQPSCPSCEKVWNTILQLQSAQMIFKSITVGFNIKNIEKNRNDFNIASGIINGYSKGNNWIESLTNQLKNKRNVAPNESKDNLLIIKELQAWCAENGFDQTPCIFINGKHFPYYYNPLDFKFLITKIFENDIHQQNVFVS